MVDISRRISGPGSAHLRLHFQEACTTKRHNVASSHFAYNRDKSLLVFRGKCRRSASHCATYSSTSCTTVVSEEIVSRYLSWDTERRELRWNRKMSLVISRGKYARLGERYSREDKTSRRKFCSSFKLYLIFSKILFSTFSKTFSALSIQFILNT